MINLIKTIACGICKGFGGGVEPSKIQHCGTIDIITASSILLDKLDEMGSKGEVYLPDTDTKIYNLKEVESSCELKEVSSLSFVAESHDCDDFAAKLYSKFASLAWTNIHALNYFIDEHETFWWIEPQNKKISKSLEPWQGAQIRFLLGR